MARKKAEATKKPAKTAVDTQARAALVALGKVMAEMYVSMPSGVDEAYNEFMACVAEFD